MERIKMSLFTARIKRSLTSSKVIQSFHSTEKDKWSMSSFHPIHIYLRKQGGPGDWGWWGGLWKQMPSEFPPSRSTLNLQKSFLERGPLWVGIVLVKKARGSMDASLKPYPIFFYCVRYYTETLSGWRKKKKSTWKAEEDTNPICRLGKNKSNYYKSFWRILKAFNTPVLIVFGLHSVSESI